VVIVSSGLALVNMPLTAAYAASKRGTAAYASALRLEYGNRISVATVYPGYVPTPIHEPAASRGVSLAGAVPQEPLEATVRAIVGACSGSARPYVPTSGMGRFAYALSRIAPHASERVVGWRMRRLVRGGHFGDAEPARALRGD
jgi:NAD(P)-dependent dehydrogenase (short-subunit alcohol dehydrogenase family)